jgi:hypothetical protein
MADPVSKIVKPTAEFLEDIARKIPQALGKGHHDIGTGIHDAADAFEDGDKKLAGDAAKDIKTAASDADKAAEDVPRPNDPNAWPRAKRKGPVKPKYRADVAGDEGKSVGRTTPHTIAKHVDKTDQELKQRLRAEPGIEASSSYLTEADAQHYTDQTLLKNQARVAAWLASTKRKLTLVTDFDTVTGRTLSREDFVRGTGARNVYGVFVQLIRDPSAPLGYRIVTSFPQDKQ